MADKTSAGKVMLTNSSTVNMIFNLRNSGVPGTPSEGRQGAKVVIPKRHTVGVSTDVWDWLKKQKIVKHLLDSGSLIVGANFGNKEPAKRLSSPKIPDDLKPPKDKKIGPAKVVVEQGLESQTLKE